jgi:uncharacterized YccA/Bax inhibitor family protein
MANPFTNEKALNEAARAGWAAPEGAPRSTPIGPITDGPVSGWQTTHNTMTVGGTLSAASVLMVLLLASAALGWNMGPEAQGEVRGFPGLALGGILLGFVAAIVVHFKPMLARIFGPVYAVGYGFFVGVISAAYNNYKDGIVLQAVGATLGVFAVVLFLYRTRILKVTDRFRRIVITATAGLMAFYLVAFVIRLIAGPGSVSFLQSTSLLSIGFSVFAAGLAAMMLAVDFDQIERGGAAGWPKGMEWYCAFGLVSTLVWLYLEILRLLAKLNRR